MKKTLFVILGMLVYSNCILSQVNIELQNNLIKDGFFNDPLYNMAFAIEELDKIISSDTSYISKWKKYVAPVIESKSYINMYSAQKQIFLYQLEQKKSIISSENYSVMKNNFANIDYEEYSNYHQFVDAYMKYPDQVNTMFMVALLTVGDEEFNDIEKAQQYGNLGFWLNEGIYSMCFYYSSKDYVVPINCRIAKYLNKKHANSKNKNIKQAVAIFNEFLEKHKGEY